MWFVYILFCDQEFLYVGITNNLSKRYHEHKSKESLFTKRYSDFELVYCEKYPDKFQAAKREKQLKGWSHNKKLLLINRKISDPHYTEIGEVFREIGEKTSFETCVERS